MPTALRRLRRVLTRRRQSITNWLALLMLLSLGFLGSPGFAQEGPSEVLSGTLLLKSSADAPAIDALRVATSIKAYVTGNVARVYVTQRFTNPSRDWVEGLYVFPLSVGSAVDELVMHVGDRTIRGEIKEKEEAHARYEQARAAGQRASLVDQERPNLFTSQVANIAPQSTVSIEIAYLESIAYRDGRFTLQLPLAITPRYNPDAGVDPAAPIAAQLTRAINAASGTTLTPERVTSAVQHVDIDVELAPGFALQSVKSLNHPVELEQDGGAQHVKLTGTRVPADRDFELVWTPAPREELQAAVFAERVGSDTYALAMLSPPISSDARSIPREVIFIIDTSGSMYGPSIEQARAALQLGVDRLSAGDRFNVIRFSNDASSLFQAPQPLNDVSRTLASRFIASLSASGGTEMKRALELAFATPPPPGMLRQIVFITDGGVSNEAELVTLIRQRIGAARLFTVGIGAAPNAYFLIEAAAAGRGSYTFIAQRGQVGARMRDLFAKLEQPALMDLALQWPGGVDAELASPLPGDLYPGDPLVILARLPGPPTGALILSGRRQGRPFETRLPLHTVGDQAGLAKLWARERIAALTRLANVDGDTPSLRRQVVELALAHHVVSPYTSLIAVDDEPLRPAGTADRSEQAPTSAPTGSYWQTGTTAFARTATAAPLWTLLGLACLGLAVLLACGTRCAQRLRE